jgi:hypothetical protein
MALDTQVVELLGRQRLIGELLRDGLEVASPARDRGIDLLAYTDLNSQVDRFVALPIQMKASTTRSFSVARKYERFANMILAYVWHLGEPFSALTYAMTYPQAIALADELGWTATSSWAKGEYSTRSPSQQLMHLLEKHRMGPGRWWSLVTGTTAIAEPLLAPVLRCDTKTNSTTLPISWG